MHGRPTACVPHLVSVACLAVCVWGVCVRRVSLIIQHIVVTWPAPQITIKPTITKPFAVSMKMHAEIRANVLKRFKAGSASLGLPQEVWSGWHAHAHAQISTVTALFSLLTSTACAPMPLPLFVCALVLSAHRAIPGTRCSRRRACAHARDPRHLSLPARCWWCKAHSKPHATIRTMSPSFGKSPTFTIFLASRNQVSKQAQCHVALAAGICTHCVGAWRIVLLA